MEAAAHTDVLQHQHYTTEGSNLKKVYNYLFGGKEKPLCKATNQVDGSCATAVGATMWHFKTSTAGGVYNDAGDKQPQAYTCSINVITPVWKESASMPQDEAEEVKKFMKSVEVHELGHAEACQQLKRSVSAFIDQLPRRVPAQMVPALNAGVQAFIKTFYERQARKSDRLFDRNTGHGGKGYAAQLTDTLQHKYDPLTEALQTEMYGGTAGSVSSGLSDSDSYSDSYDDESQSDNSSTSSEDY
jgi:hypothetical protein